MLDRRHLNVVAGKPASFPRHIFGGGNSVWFQKLRKEEQWAFSLCVPPFVSLRAGVSARLRSWLAEPTPAVATTPPAQSNVVAVTEKLTSIQASFVHARTITWSLDIQLA